jgi:hypothetical protein
MTSQVASKLIENLRFLHQMGYSDPVVTKENSELLGDSLLLKYASTEANRALEIGFVERSASRQGSLSVFIVNQVGESFSLEDWIAAKGTAGRLRFLQDEFESEDEFIRKFSRDLETLVDGEIHGTLIGKEWDAVPFDWKGYR